MKFNSLMGTLSFALTTVATPIVIPEKYHAVSTLLIGAQNSDAFITWRRQASATSTNSKLCAASDEAISFNVRTENPIFYAKTTTGTGTLEIELWR